MTARRDPTRHHPTTVSNSLQILEAVAGLGLGVTAKEIAGALHMPPATAYRLLNALVADEYLVRTSDLRGFGLGARLDGFIAAAAAPTLGTSARNTLAQIRTELRFAVHLVAFQQWSLRIVDADPDHPVRAERDLVRHLYASSAGRLLLADQRTWQSRLPATPLRRIAPATVTDLAALDIELAAVRERQFAVQVDQLEAGLACAAVPIHDSAGDAAAALCIAGPSSRVEALLEHITDLRSCAAVLAPLIF
ncbi:IclR family transcriptional regulator [Mycolicibacterium confluentis]|uniref:IclR family transcriptional regulator n=1 Tax=Mycolicibacterium confluentis TaxID=28047 RepID=A0A7I7Y4V7_9MYCO|nr:IclR family transcriptional regulator C-terminal domain-containing protein [Mycolicibacterium confluentis]MCV7322744.1 helix-turn-helix domain-containing protein [Mycolicibacterium confluentis]ORV29731.1 IclR family transcriptional regulator [Mycolicibacterium confluentis]BBZ36354.1 IclR family transcriptional regulator [Mycolicibacterium confluentis]